MEEVERRRDLRNDDRLVEWRRLLIPLPKLLQDMPGLELEEEEQVRLVCRWVGVEVEVEVGRQDRAEGGEGGLLQRRRLRLTLPNEIGIEGKAVEVVWVILDVEVGEGRCREGDGLEKERVLGRREEEEGTELRQVRIEVCWRTERCCFMFRWRCWQAWCWTRGIYWNRRTDVELANWRRSEQSLEAATSKLIRVCLNHILENYP